MFVHTVTFSYLCLFALLPQQLPYHHHQVFYFLWAEPTQPRGNIGVQHMCEGSPSWVQSMPTWDVCGRLQLSDTEYSLAASKWSICFFQIAEIQVAKGTYLNLIIFVISILHLVSLNSCT